MEELAKSMADLVTTTSSDFCELEIPVKRDVETGIITSKSTNLVKFCDTCNCDSTHSVVSTISQQPTVTTIRVNRFMQSRTGRLSKNTTQVLCNKSVGLPDFQGNLIALILHKGPPDITHLL